MLVRDEQPIDVLGRERPRRWRNEAQLVRAHPRVDDDTYSVGLEPEPRLAEPGGAHHQAIPGRNNTMIYIDRASSQPSFSGRFGASFGWRRSWLEPILRLSSPMLRR